MNHPLENIRWKTLCPWLLLVDSLRLAFRVRVLLLAIVGAVLILPFVEWAIPSYWDLPYEGAFEGSLSRIGSRQGLSLIGPELEFASPWVGLATLQWNAYHYFVLIVLAVWRLAVWSLFGGAICRIAALALTRGESPDLPNAIRFAKRNYGAFFAAPLMTIGGVLLTSLPLAVLGLLMRIEWLAFIIALLWPVILLMGLILALLAIGLVIGFPLMWSAVAVEETDAFDAISRSYAYVYQRPLRLLWYVLVAAVLGWIGGLVVDIVLSATRNLAEGTVIRGFGVENWNPPGERTTVTRIILFWTAGLNVLRAAYYYAYFWSAAVGIYLLMRRDIDSVQLDEVAVEPMETYKPSPLVAAGAAAESQPPSS